MKKEIQNIFLLALGAIAGAIIRWQFKNNILMNLIGSSILGLVFGLQVRGRAYILFGIGFCGSLTTFSGLMLDVYMLLNSGLIYKAISSIFLSLIFGVFFALIGFLVGRLIFVIKPFQFLQSRFRW